MQELVFSGQINRIRGIGSFVGHKTISYGMNELVSITTLIQQNGYKAAVKHAMLEVTLPQQVHRELLNLSEMEPVYNVRRVFTANDKPVVYEEVVYPAKILPGVEEKDFIGSSFKMMGDRGLHVASADGCVRPQRATSHMATLLNIPRGSPLLLMETVLVDRRNKKLAYVKDYFTEWFEFPIRRTRRP